MKSERLNVIELVLFAIFAIGIMLATVMASEDDNPFQATRSPPDGASAPVNATRVFGARPVAGTVQAPSK